jgi:hypothetical protein
MQKMFIAIGLLILMGVAASFESGNVIYDSGLTFTEEEALSMLREHGYEPEQMPSGPQAVNIDGEWFSNRRAIARLLEVQLSKSQRPVNCTTYGMSANTFGVKCTGSENVVAVN